MRVLLIAPYCDGTDVGEARSTYEWAHRLADACDLTVLACTRIGRPPVAAQVPRARVIEWCDRNWLMRHERLNAMLKPGYLGFYQQARRWLQRALAAGEQFDIAHQVAPLALRYPCPAAGLGLRLVVGPLGGSLATPPAFARECADEPWYVQLRRLDAFRLRHDPWLRRSYRTAHVVIGVAPYVRDLLRSIPLQRFEIASETGITELPPVRAEHARADGELRLLYVGRVVRSKGVRDAVRALSSLQDLPRVTLDVVGDGQDRRQCEVEVKRLGLRERVRFQGWVPRACCETFYAAADVFLFPSLREPSGNVVFEALSNGLPVIAGARGGPGYVVDDSCGLRVPVTNPEAYAKALAEAVRRLAGDAELRRRLSAGARLRVAEVALWDGKIAWLQALYAGVLQACRSRERWSTPAGNACGHHLQKQHQSGESVELER